MLRLGPLLLLATLAAGCPGELQPPGPGEGTPCERHEDCNPGRSCGALLLCVDGHCESSPSRLVPCPGEGERPE